MSAGAILADAAPARDAVAQRTPRRSAGTQAAAVLLGGAVAAAFGGAGAVVHLAFAPAAVLLAVWLLARDDHVGYLELTLWLWLVGPGVRRIVDFTSTFHPQSPVLTAAFLVSLVGLPVALAQRQRVARGIRIAFFLGFACVAYATVAGLLLNPFAAVAASLLTWLAPIALGFFVVMTPAPWLELRGMLLRVVVWGLLILGGYGVAQWFLVPAWDAFWLERIGDAGRSFGQPAPTEVRIWSLSNGPGPLAGLLVFLLLCLSAVARRGLMPVALVVGGLALALSSVRAAWIAVGLGLLLVAWRGQVRLLRTAVIVVAVVIGFAVAGGPIADQVSDRARTFVSGREDESARARLRFQALAVPAAISDPVGRGMGSTGAGVRFSGQGARAAFADTDSGFLEVLRTFGAVAGVMLLAGVLLPCLGAFILVRQADALVIAVSAALAVVPVSMVFGNALGLTTWLAMAIVGREDARAGR